MRRSPNATTRLRRQNAQSVSLFPFLAVLICTMGALIVLLVVIAQQARLQATREAIAQADGDVAQLREDLQDGLEMAELMVSQLDESCQRTEIDLKKARFQLGQVEQHAQQLAAQLPKLRAELAEMEKSPTGSGQLGRLRSDLETIEGQIILARQQLARAALNSAPAKPASYAIIPYEGAHGTNRRPIYIECRADSIVLQPEGIRLSDADFLGPMGPGNPLDVALRATREYWVSSQVDAASADSWEPYPLLLVRPSGIMAYYTAREAMASWGSQVGYELIDEDWPLKFPEADPAMAAEVERAVAIARRRNQQLAAIAPSHYGRSSRPRFSASPGRGGLVPLGASSDSTEDGFASNRASDPFGRRFTSDAEESSNTPVSTYSPVSSDPVATQGSAAATDPTTATAGSAVAGRGDKAAVIRIAPVTEETASSNVASSLAGGASENLYPNTATQRQPSEKPGSFRQMMNRLGSGREQGSVANAIAGSQAGPAETVSESSGRAPSGANTVAPAQVSSCRSLARIRGRNWGLSDQASDSIPLSRPIRVECYEDRLVVVPAEGTTGGQIVALKDRTEDTIDTFVSALWDHMTDWKNAGQGMHWRPTLNVYVAEDAKNRFADLNVLLEGSGLSVKYAGLLRAESWRTAARTVPER